MPPSLAGYREASAPLQWLAQPAARLVLLLFTYSSRRRLFINQLSQPESACLGGGTQDREGKSKCGDTDADHRHDQTRRIRAPQKRIMSRRVPQTPGWNRAFRTGGYPSRRDL